MTLKSEEGGEELVEARVALGKALTSLGASLRHYCLK